MSGHVTSHVTHLPIFQGTNVIPSGLFSSFKNRPVGSLDAGTPDRMHARKIMSFNILCLLVRPALLLHDNPWMPKTSTMAPQGQPCGAHKFTPSLKPMATRTASSSILRPQEEIGMAFNQSPLCGACEARRRALLYYCCYYSFRRTGQHSAYFDHLTPPSGKGQSWIV